MTLYMSGRSKTEREWKEKLCGWRCWKSVKKLIVSQIFTINIVKYMNRRHKPEIIPLLAGFGSILDSYEMELRNK